MSAIRQIQARRIERVYHAAQTRIRRPLQGDDLVFSFRCRMGWNSDGDPVVLVWKGWRQIDGQEPVRYKNGSEDEWVFDWSNGAFVWFKFTYTTPSAAGAWGAIGIGVPDAETTAQGVWRLCECVTVDGAPSLEQIHFGLVKVLDDFNCGDCS